MLRSISNQWTQAWDRLPSLPRVNLSTFLKVSLVALAAFNPAAALIRSGALSCQDRLASLQDDMNACTHTALIWDKMKKLEWSVACNITMPHSFYLDKPNSRILFPNETPDAAEKIPALVIFTVHQIEDLPSLYALNTAKCSFEESTNYINRYIQKSYKALIKTIKITNKCVTNGQWPSEWLTPPPPSIRQYRNYQHIRALEKSLEEEWAKCILLKKKI